MHATEKSNWVMCEFGTLSVDKTNDEWKGNASRIGVSTTSEFWCVNVIIIIWDRCLCGMAWATITFTLFVPFNVWSVSVRRKNSFSHLGLVWWRRPKIRRQFCWLKQMIRASISSYKCVCWRKWRPPNDSDHYKFQFTLLIFRNRTACHQYAISVVIWRWCKRVCWFDNSIWTHVGVESVCLSLSHPLPSFFVVIRK